MIMKDEIWNLIIKRLTDTETDQSKIFLDNWLSEHSENQKTYHEATLLWSLTANLKTEDIIDSPPQLSKENKQKKPNIFWRYSIAAACIITITISALLFNHERKNDHTLVWISQAAMPGKLLSVTLPDSSRVVLNAGSTIQYLKDFKYKKTRVIKLSGEAFFDVKHKADRPFVVESHGIKTVVYGTSFNVKAYANEKEITVAVKTGKVGVIKNDSSSAAKPIFLLPNNSLTFNTSTQSFSKINKQTSMANEWEKGTLVFEQTPVLEVFETLSRRFAVKFNTQDYHHTSCSLSARFENQELKTVLKVIQTVMNIKINQIDQTIYVKGGQACKEN